MISGGTKDLVKLAGTAEKKYDIPHEQVGPLVQAYEGQSERICTMYYDDASVGIVDPTKFADCKDLFMDGNIRSMEDMEGFHRASSIQDLIDDFKNGDRFSRTFFRNAVTNSPDGWFRNAKLSLASNPSLASAVASGVGERTKDVNIGLKGDFTYLTSQQMNYDFALDGSFLNRTQARGTFGFGFSDMYWYMMDNKPDSDGNFSSDASVQRGSFIDGSADWAWLTSTAFVGGEWAPISALSDINLDGLDVLALNDTQQKVADLYTERYGATAGGAYYKALSADLAVASDYAVFKTAWEASVVDSQFILDKFFATGWDAADKPAVVAAFAQSPMSLLDFVGAKFEGGKDKVLDVLENADFDLKPFEEGSATRTHLETLVDAIITRQAEFGTVAIPKDLNLATSTQPALYPIPSERELNRKDFVEAAKMNLAAVAKKYGADDSEAAALVSALPPGFNPWRLQAKIQSVIKEAKKEFSFTLRRSWVVEGQGGMLDRGYDYTGLGVMVGTTLAPTTWLSGGARLYLIPLDKFGMVNDFGNDETDRRLSFAQGNEGFAWSVAPEINFSPSGLLDLNRRNFVNDINLKLSSYYHSAGSDAAPGNRSHLGGGVETGVGFWSYGDGNRLKVSASLAGRMTEQEALPSGASSVDRHRVHFGTGVAYDASGDITKGLALDLKWQHLYGPSGLDFSEVLSNNSTDFDSNTDGSNSDGWKRSVGQVHDVVALSAKYALLGGSLYLKGGVNLRWMEKRTVIGEESNTDQSKLIPSVMLGFGGELSPEKIAGFLK